MKHIALLFLSASAAAMLSGCSVMDAAVDGAVNSVAGAQKPDREVVLTMAGTRDSEGLVSAASMEFRAGDAWGVRSSDGSVSCYVKAGTPFQVECDAKFNDPPLMPSPKNPSMYSNMVRYEDGHGFVPAVRNGNPTPSRTTTLKVGEKVSLDRLTLKATDSTTFVAELDGHYFKLSGGAYFSDRFPEVSDSSGRAHVGAVCEEYSGGLLYVAAENTSCEQGRNAYHTFVEKKTDGPVDFDGWTCWVGEEKNWHDGQKRPTCSHPQYGRVIRTER